MRKLSLLLAFIAVILHANSQNYDDSKCWIWVDNSDYVASNSPEFTVDGTFNTRLLNNGVISYKQALPFAKNPELLLRICRLFLIYLIM